MIPSDPERFNMFFFIWLMVSPIIMLYVTLSKPHKKKIIIGIILSVVLTFAFSNLSVMRKWDLRIENAVTAEEKEDAYADGANKAFNLIFLSPVESLLFTIFWAGVGCIIFRIKGTKKV